MNVQAKGEKAAFASCQNDFIFDTNPILKTCQLKTTFNSYGKTLVKCFSKKSKLISHEHLPIDDFQTSTKQIYRSAETESQPKVHED